MSATATSVKFGKNFQRAMASIASAKPTLILQNAMKLSPIAFRIVASHAPYKDALLESDYVAMVQAATNNQFQLLSDTFEPLGISNGQRVVSGIIEAYTAVKDYDPSYVKDHMAVLAENIFRDKDDDSIWNVVTNGDQKYLVQSVKEDFGQLIGARLARTSAQIVANANYAGIVPANGDYICYYSPNNHSLAWGYALATDQELQVFERKEKKLHTIHPAHVVICAQGNSLDNKYNMVKWIAAQSPNTNRVLADDFTPAAQSAYLDYMRTLYSGTDYFTKLEQLIMHRRRTDIGELHLNHD
jgi:hypothetical protein